MWHNTKSASNSILILCWQNKINTPPVAVQLINSTGASDANAWIHGPGDWSLFRWTWDHVESGRIYSTLETLVSLQTTWLSDALITLCTVLRFFPNVDELVSLQATYKRKTLVTLCTAERFFLTMDSFVSCLMTFEMTSTSEPLPALVTVVGLLSCMNYLVTF